MAAVPILSARELWQAWITRGVLDPSGYDADLAKDLANSLGASPSDDLAIQMDEAQWDAKRLLRALSPTLSSFYSLMRDLLLLYSRISAQHASGENLTISYHFEEGDPFDESLASFRRQISTLKRAIEADRKFVYSQAHAREFPFRRRHHQPGEQATIQELRQTPSGRPEDREWNFSLPPAPASQVPHLQKGADLVYQVLRAAMDSLRDLGNTFEEACSITQKQYNRAKPHSPSRDLLQDCTDFWPENVSYNLQRCLTELEQRPSDARDWAQSVEEWCSHFWHQDAQTDPGTATEALESVLSLPSWGKRHELYSAWVICLLDRAIGPRRLNYVVDNNRLSFPFSGAELAHFKSAGGRITLWCELRSKADGPMSGGRKAGIQPDFRFIREPEGAPAENGIRDATELAIEVKQYRKPAAAKHGRTAEDYARNLPQGEVVLVGHGPIGETVRKYVAPKNQARVHIYEHLQQVDSNTAAGFIKFIRSLYPNRPLEARLSWQRDKVERLSISLCAIRGGSILQDPQECSAQIPEDFDGNLLVQIDCHPSRSHGLREAAPEVTISFESGEIRRLSLPSEIADSSRTWTISLRDLET